MPKKIFDSFIRDMARDIKLNYKSGDKYLTIREIAERFSVSVQTAQRGIRRIEEEGIVSVKKKSGIFILSPEQTRNTEGKKLVVLSNKQDHRFYHAFLEGVKNRAENTGMEISFYVNTRSDTDSLGFGNFLTELDADGIIALSFLNSALPFYHVIREGLDIVSDVIIDNLPILPAIQTDNYIHAQFAGNLLLEKGYKRFYVFGYYPKNINKRYKGFYDAIKSSGRKIAYINLSEMEAMRKTDAILHDLKDDTACFSSDYSANYILASQFVKHNLKVTNDNLLMYDSEEDFFHHPGLPPVRCVAPSFFKLGEVLCDLIICKFLNGKYPEPLQRKI